LTLREKVETAFSTAEDTYSRFASGLKDSATGRPLGIWAGRKRGGVRGGKRIKVEGEREHAGWKSQATQYLLGYLFLGGYMGISIWVIHRTQICICISML
jgi:hypothetical protein